MVEVTRSNFNEIFPLVEESIKNSTFIAIDAEFTGLCLGPANENNLFDTIQERYEKYRCRATNFVPCQIGLSTFTKCLNDNSYSVDTYVFYIRPSMVGSIDRIISCQASALDFLGGYNFDFNKFIQKGIPYMNENEEVQVRKEIEDGSICLPHEKMRDQRYQANLSYIINNKLLSKMYRPDISEEKVIFSIDEKSHVYFQLCELRRRFPKLWAYVEDDAIIVKVPSPEERENIKESIADEKEKVLKDFLGFTRVFRLLKECQKPIVGHNLLMDLMLFYQNFHQNLPSSYDKFKKELHSIFPVVYDTKHIWLHIKDVQKFKKFAANSSLTALYELLKNPPDYLMTLYSPSIFPSNCKIYYKGDFVHDSGYDAFITGYVFLKLCHILAIEKIPSTALFVKLPSFKEHLDALSPFVNKVNFPYFRLQYINFDGTDPLPKVQGCLHISPRAWFRTLSYEELNFCFSKHNALEFRFIKGKKAAIAVAPSGYILQRILKEFKDDPNLLVEEYSFLKHSPYVSATLWLVGLTSSGLLAAWIWKSS